MTVDEPGGSPALAEAIGICRTELGPPTAAEIDHGLDRFLARVATHRAPRFPRWALAGASLALCALLAWPAVSALRKRFHQAQIPTLTYRIDGGTVLEGGYLRESGHEGMNVTFNEGSSLALTPGTRSRLQVVDRDAHVAIERGRAFFRVTHHDGRRWLVDVGPFLVTVTGTAFTAAWDPVREELDLRLSQGTVVVSGPVSAGEITLRAGQRLLASVARVEAVITEDAPEPAPDAHPSPAPLAPTDHPGLPTSLTMPSRSATSATERLAHDHRWSRRLASGQWDRILAEAEHSGVEAMLSQASSDDLFALANAARYRRRLALARAALLAERRRFPNSARAVEALYLLGRVDEASETGAAQAIAWYDEYLHHVPSGPLLGEALGRKMTLTDKLAGPAQARALAEDYLRRFPRGNYAGLARELLAP